MVGIEIEDAVVEDDVNVVDGVAHPQSGVTVTRVEFFAGRTGDERDLCLFAQRLCLCECAQRHAQTEEKYE